MEEEIRKPVKRSFSPELIVALSAVFVSIVTLGVYMYQARIMRDQLRMSAWPYIQWSYTELSDAGFTLSVHNKGVGPALLRKTTLLYKGKPVKDLADLLRGAAGTDTLAMFVSDIDNTVMEPGDRVEFFHVYVHNEREYKLMPKLGKAFYDDLSFAICFCDIYGDCWESTGTKVVASECGKELGI
jgi:hypothetical protein